jgi:hypothetical protein
VTAEVAIVVGLAAIAAILGDFAFRLSNSSESHSQKASIFVALISLLFLDLLVFTMYKIAETDLPDLIPAVLNTALLVIVWLTSFVVVGVFVVNMYRLLVSVKDSMKDIGKGRRGRENEED